MLKRAKKVRKLDIPKTWDDIEFTPLDQPMSKSELHAFVGHVYDAAVVYCGGHIGVAFDALIEVLAAFDMVGMEEPDEDERVIDFDLEGLDEEEPEGIPARGRFLFSLEQHYAANCDEARAAGASVCHACSLRKCLEGIGYKQVELMVFGEMAKKMGYQDGDVTPELWVHPVDVPALEDDLAKHEGDAL